MDDLSDDDNGLVVFCLVLESDETSNDVSSNSSDYYEDKESEKYSIYFCTVWTHSCYFECSIAAFAACLSLGNRCSLFIQASISACFFHSSASYCALLTRLSSLQDSS